MPIYITSGKPMVLSVYNWNYILHQLDNHIDWKFIGEEEGFKSVYDYDSLKWDIIFLVMRRLTREFEPQHLSHDMMIVRFINDNFPSTSPH